MLRFRHLQTGVLSTLPLPRVLLPCSRSLPASPALVPLLRHWHTGISSPQQCHPTPQEQSQVTFLISALDSVWSSSRDCSSLIFSPSSSLSCTHLAFEDTRLGAKCKSKIRKTQGGGNGQRNFDLPGSPLCPLQQKLNSAYKFLINPLGLFSKIISQEIRKLI